MSGEKNDRIVHELASTACTSGPGKSGIQSIATDRNRFFEMERFERSNKFVYRIVQICVRVAFETRAKWRG